MEIIEFNKDLGEFFLFKEDGLLDSDSFQKQLEMSQKNVDVILLESFNKHQIIFRDNTMNNIGIVVNRNNEIKIKLIDIKFLEGFNLIYDKPAKGGGIINLCGKFKDNSETLVYGYVNVDKDPKSGWNYKEWTERIDDFEKNILAKLKDWTGKEILSVREYSNC